MAAKDFIIVIGRQYGSGGREIARLVANRLSIPYYDKELLARTAEEFGYRKELFLAGDEKKPSVLGSILSACYGATNYTSEDSARRQMYKLTSRMIESLAERGPCVFVGRTADYVLRRRPDVASVFIHSTDEAKSSRIMKRGEASTAEEALALAQKRDRLRENYYNFFTGRRWGVSANYDLSVNSGLLGPEKTADVLIGFLDTLPAPAPKPHCNEQ